MSSPLEDHFFVYGTLAPGRPNEHVLAAVPGTWRPATVRGTLRELGWGAAQGFPGIMLDCSSADDAATGDSGTESGVVDGAVVDGLVLPSPKLGDHWDRLDEFEGPEYERATVTARLEDGTNVAAQIYALRA